MKKYIVVTVLFVALLISSTYSFAAKPTSQPVIIWSDPIQIPGNDTPVVGYCSFLNIHPTATAYLTQTFHTIDLAQPSETHASGGEYSLEPSEAFAAGMTQFPQTLTFCSVRLDKRRETDHLDPNFIRAIFTIYNGSYDPNKLGLPLIYSPLK